MQMKDVHKKLESAANVAIIVIAIMFGIAVVTKYFVTESAPAAPQQKAIEPNTKFALGDVDWSTNEKNLVLAFSTKCRFCIESIDLYKRLTQTRNEKRGFRIILVSPQPVEEIRKFLAEQEIDIADVVQSPLSAISIGGTPTLVLVDKSGRVQNSWVGKLPPNGESELIAALNP